MGRANATLPARSPGARPPRPRPFAPLADQGVGTFKDNKNAPVHRWFQYPAGFSFRAVEHALRSSDLDDDATVYDPFAGTGTTLVVCKGRGLPSVGVEAHPLVARIARTKVRWDLDPAMLEKERRRFLERLPTHVAVSSKVSELPELVRKCYSPRNLAMLLEIRDRLPEVGKGARDLFEVALISTLRAASAAATGWPYIAPRKRIEERDARSTFELCLGRCLDDLAATPPGSRNVPSTVLEADAREPPLERATVDLAFTSPPYLNNYDYADRLRLETYFLGMAGSWAEITQRFRSKLVVAATTQVLRQERPPEEVLSGVVARADPAVAEELTLKTAELSRRRRERPGQKSYDHMVARYFEDMTRALTATRRVLRPGGRFILILGDSAPYGVPIPTEEYLGRLGLGTGFRGYKVVPLRRRGEKWRSNPQRHHVPLKESWLVLEG